MRVNKGNKQKVIERNDYLAVIMFYFITLFQTLLFTSFSVFYPQMAKMIYKIELIILVMYVIYSVTMHITLRKLLYAAVTLIVIVLLASSSGIFSPFTKLLLLALAVPATIPSSKKIVKIFGWAMMTTMFLSITMSLLGYLPISGTTSRVLFSNYKETVYFLGFSHPNAFGTYLTAIFTIFAYLYFEKYKKRILFMSPFVFIINIIIGAGTAAAGVLLIFLIMVIPIKLKKIYNVIYLLPVLFTCFSLWLAYNNSSNLGIIIGNKIASRPNVWHAYVTQFPINFVNKTPQINTTGYFGILGNGVLDGSYIYILIFWGILAWIIYNVIFISLSKFAIETNNVVLYGISLLTMVSAFPESHMIMFFENVFLLFVGFYQYSSSERKKCLTS